MTRLWKFLLASVAGLFGLLILLGSGIGGGGSRLAAYLKRREKTEADDKAEADAALAQLAGHIVDANAEIRSDADSPADTLNRAGR
jgi:hypothetical protein